MPGCTCGSKEFYAYQVCYIHVVCDESGVFLYNIAKHDGSLSVYKAENPHGPYQCTQCKAIYDELPKVLSSDDCSR